MQSADESLRKTNDWCVDVSNCESATRNLQDVLSRGLPSLRRCAFRLLGNAADAEDAVQDALLAAYRHLDQFRGQSQMSTWLNAIVSNCARMQLRKRSREIRVSLDERIGEERDYSLSEALPDGRPNPEDEFQNSEMHAHLRRFVAGLSPRLRKTFQLRDIRGLSIREAAGILGIPSGTVKVQLARARSKLKCAMRRGLEPRSRAPQSGVPRLMREYNRTKPSTSSPPKLIGSLSPI